MIVTKRNGVFTELKDFDWQHLIMQIRSRKIDSTLYIPARNEAATIGSVVDSLLDAVSSRKDFQTNIVVVDDRSTDSTAKVALCAGATVISTEDFCNYFGGSKGKGDAIWASLRHCETQLIGWADGDLTELSSSRLLQMFDALRRDSKIQLAKAWFDRVHEGKIADRGRVTLLTAIPLLEMLFPDVGQMNEPLSGMFAGRTSVLSSLWLDCDYGVDIGVVLDIALKYGSGSIFELYIGEIEHRNRCLNELSGTAQQVARAIISRSSAESLVTNSVDYRRIPPKRQASLFV